jgi:uncharacterized surface protein with fasciclin (FAS1) repeats
MKKIKILFNTVLLLSLLLFTFSFISCEKEFKAEPFYKGIYEGINQSITEFIQAREDSFSRFESALQTGELEKTLTAYNPKGNDYTLFLPTNEAFDKFISNTERYGSFGELMDDKDYVKNLVRYHTVNMALTSSDFPFGSLPDTTLSGDLLTISFSSSGDSAVQKVNNFANVILPDVTLTNGYVHVIDEVLRPVIYNHYEWLNRQDQYSIFAKALEITGLKDTFNLQTNGDAETPSSTMLIESNEVFAKKNITSVEDLKEKYSPDRQDYTNYTNGLYQFVAYHILEGKRFLNSFEGVTTNYNTYASLPLNINGNGLNLRINRGVENFDTLVTNQDTTIIDYITVKYDQSNVITKNGAIHFIENVMERYKPRSTTRSFQFYSEPVIFEASQRPSVYIYEKEDRKNFQVLNWTGIEEIRYVKSSSELSGIWNNDYIEINGDFTVTFKVPKVLPGKYMFQIRANDEYYNNATVQVFLDGKRIGGNFDLSTNPNNWSAFNNFDIGQVNLANYEEHEVKIKTLIPGRLTWDAVRFVPSN